MLIAGARSPTGGSALILNACREGGFRAVASHGVLVEVERNLQTAASALDRFHHDLASIAWTLIPTPTEESLYAYTALIERKDVHVLAAARAASCEFLLTLDRRHFFTTALQQAGLSIIIVTPAQFIQQYFPQHPDYPFVQNVIRTFVPPGKPL